MATGNRGFAKGLAGAGTEPAANAAARLPPRTGILGARDNRLAQLASGRTVTRVHELVDPARCRIWPGHNRDYAALNAETCADLIESFKAQGRQEVPAIVRRIGDDPDHQYEVICGARRHWTAAWLRAHDHPEFRFLIEPRELTDEEAFRIADLENRSRRDLSDYERAADYARAVERYYEGSQQRMAERLEVSRSWLSRYLELAKLPAEILAAFGSPHVIRISHGAVLAPLLRLPPQRERMIAEARAVGASQAERATRGAAPMPPATVLQRLTVAAKPPSRTSRPGGECVIRDSDGSIVARGQRAARGGAVAISVPALGKFRTDGILDAVRAILEHFRAASG
jgi:ParB family transcriptional regulator, chromosome partitioning protein